MLTPKQREEYKKEYRKFVFTPPEIGFKGNTADYWLDIIDKRDEELVKKIKQSFISNFYRSGERWYNYLFKEDDEEEKEDALQQLEDEWNDIINPNESKE